MCCDEVSNVGDFLGFYLGFTEYFRLLGHEELCMAFGIPCNPELGGCGDESAKCGEEAGVNSKKYHCNVIGYILWDLLRVSQIEKSERRLA